MLWTGQQFIKGFINHLAGRSTFIIPANLLEHFKIWCQRCSVWPTWTQETWCGDDAMCSWHTSREKVFYFPTTFFHVV